MKILVATDSHLGYKDTNPVRCLDSFAAFEEVLMLAKEEEVDMVLLGGDLFHDNKPSRPTLHRAMSLLRSHVFGDRPVEFQVISDQRKNFKSAECANYENPFVSVSLPIFSIHGNHDDPMRDGGVEALAPLDLLAASNMVNYFGAAQKVDDVSVSPVILRKGKVNVALYGLGHIREERLNRVWQSGKLKFLRPREDDRDETGTKRYHYVLVLHQNREIGRGLKSHIHEDMIPKWFDLVIWGHEHESRSQLENSVAGSFRISQPGSSVATSLSDGEARQKHVCVLSVRLKDRAHQFMLKYIPLTMVRPFVVGSASLAELVEDERERGEADVGKLLAAKVEAMIETALSQAPPPRFPNQTFKINESSQPLVRLKVDTDGFQAVNAQKFGGQFVGKVANPSEILHYSRNAQKRNNSKKNKSGLSSTQPAEEDEMDTVRVEDLVRTLLDTSEQRFELFEETKLNDALVEYVDKAETGALNDAVDKSLAHMQRVLTQKKRRDDDEDDEDQGDLRAQVAEETRRKNEKARAKRRNSDKDEESQSIDDNGTAPSSKRRRDGEDEEEEESRAPRRRKEAPKKKRRHSPDESSEESEDEAPRRVATMKRGRNARDESDDEPPPSAKRRAPVAAAKRGSATNRGRRQPIVVDSDEEEEEPAPTRASRRGGRERKKVAYVEEEDDIEEDDDDEEDYL